MRLISSLILAVVAIAAVLFALSNRALVSIGIWPLANQATVQLYVVVLVPLGAGLLLGFLLATFATVRARLAARSHARRADVAERELVALRASSAVSASAPAATVTPLQPVELP